MKGKGSLSLVPISSFFCVVFLSICASKSNQLLSLRYTVFTKVIVNDTISLQTYPSQKDATHCQWQKDTNYKIIKLPEIVGNIASNVQSQDRHSIPPTTEEVELYDSWFNCTDTMMMPCHPPHFQYIYSVYTPKISIWSFVLLSWS